ncbi:hypothetical protein AAEO50_06705 [Rossellomorea oryzaecorticis]|uniref:ABC transporter Uup C-terminal domain-containing protein n=1 Tax=Rossellomorea oryzaecorticis TaxID=1396505 RepID=A0ABU9K900_9BACI
MEALENDIIQLEEAMGGGGMEHEELDKLYRRKRELSEELESTMEVWLKFAE